MTNGQDGEVVGTVIAPAYDATKAYKTGILLSYQGKMYLCIKDAPAGTLPTNTTYFEEKSVADIIEMIKDGRIVVGQARNAKAINPISSESGTMQTAPFISQGTGTANNSASVDTSDEAKHLEKMGNTIVKNQLLPTNAIPSYAGSSGVTFTNNGDGTYTIDGTASANTGTPSYVIPSTVGHVYFIRGSYLHIMTADGSNIQANAGVGTVKTATADGFSVNLRVASGNTVDNLTVFPIFVDITSWPAEVITDLTANPSHFPWYYNGSLAYDAGSLQNCNGRYLVCTHRNIYKPAEAYNIVVPNRAYNYKGGSTTTITYYDKDKNSIGTESVASGSQFTTPANCVYIASSVTSGVTISLYYTPEQGGEGYDADYPYQEPNVYDTGAEPLKAYDYKTPDGVVHGKTTERTFTGAASEAWVKSSGTGDNPPYFYISIGTLGSVVDDHAKSNILLENPNIKTSNSQLGFRVFNSDGGGNARLLVRANTTMEVLADFKTWLASNNLTVQWELSEETTTQGTSFPEAIEVEDYGMMYWLDTDGNLVSIPQGCKVFYPVDYVLWLDTAVGRTSGDATDIALVSETNDTALAERGYNKTSDLYGVFGTKETAGGILRQLLVTNNALAEATLNFNNTAFVDLSELAWNYSTNGTGFWLTSTAISPKPNAVQYSEFGNGLCSTMKINKVSNIQEYNGKGIGWYSGGYLYCNNGSTTTKPTGLLAYEKATT